MSRRSLASLAILVLVAAIAALAGHFARAPVDSTPVERDAGPSIPPVLASSPARPHPGALPPASPEQELLDALRYAAEHPPRLGPESPRRRLYWTGDKVAFDHRGKRLASHGGEGIALWDCETWELLWNASVQGSIQRLFFSPDDRFVYVAGGGREAILLRLDAATGRVDREYSGVERSADAVVSRDGRTLAAFSSHAGRLTFFDADDGEVLRTEAARGFRLIPGPGGASLIARGGETGWMLHSFAPATPVPFPFDEAPASLASVVACDDPNLLVVVNREVDPPFFEAEGSVAVLRRRDDVWHVEKEIRLPRANQVQYPTLSGDGSLLATAGNGNQVRVFSIPELDLIGEWEFPRSPAAKLSVCGFSFSADGSMLAVGRGAAFPGLLAVDRSAERKVRDAAPWTLHLAPVFRVDFTANGADFRTIDRDGVAFVWDAATVRSIARWRLPAQANFLCADDEHGRLLCVAPRDPSDVDAVYEGRGDGDVLQWVDAATGELRARVTPPPGFLASSARGLRAGRAWLVGDEGRRLGELDLERGALVSSTALDDHVSSGSDWVVEGRTALFPDCYLPRGDTPSYVRAHLDSGHIDHVQALDAASLRANFFGFVPGGKHAYSAGQEVRLYDLATLTEVARHPVGDDEVRGITFSDDGSRYALVRNVKNIPESARVGIPEEAQILTVHDTLTGRMLLAAPVAVGVSAIALDKTGRVLAAVGDDGRARVWDVPAGR